MHIHIYIYIYTFIHTSITYHNIYSVDANGIRCCRPRCRRGRLTSWYHHVSVCVCIGYNMYSMCVYIYIYMYIINYTLYNRCSIICNNNTNIYIYIYIYTYTYIYIYILSDRERERERCPLQLHDLRQRICPPLRAWSKSADADGCIIIRLKPHTRWVVRGEDSVRFWWLDAAAEDLLGGIGQFAERESKLP